MRIFLISFCVLLFGNGFAQDNFEVTIERKLTSNECTMGYLFVNGTLICYTLELPWKDNSNDVSCIPIGTYQGVLRYDKKDGWRIQLENVPNRSGVQIHMGNYTSQIKGCVLVGQNANVDDCSVSNSSQAYANLKNAFYGQTSPTSTPNKRITVTVK